MKITALVFWLLIVFSPLGEALESSLLSHMLIEIPALVIIGIIFGNSIKPKIENTFKIVNLGGISGILLACFGLAFWMIPAWFDASVNSALIAYAKYVSLTMLVGIPLAVSWQHLHTITKGVIKIEFLTMLFRLGWLYLISPDRLCNNYLIGEQIFLGRAFIAIGLALGITWLLQVFFSSTHRTPITTITMH